MISSGHSPLQGDHVSELARSLVGTSLGGHVTNLVMSLTSTLVFHVTLTIIQ